MSNLKLSILSPERRLVERTEVEEVTLTGSEGQIQILPGHAAMMGTLETGLFSYRAPSGQTQTGVVSTGFFEVHDDLVTLLAETIEVQGEIDFDRAKRAQQEAERILSQAELDPSQFKKYQLKLERSLIRQQLASRGFSEAES